jgi:serine/threonine protein kinase
MRARRKPVAPEVGPGTDVGSYVVEAPLGAGGFATVFLARRGGQLHALKLLSLRDHAGWAEREVLVLTHVRHRNVAQLRGFWQWPDQEPRYLVVVMEYVAGRRLDAWARAENPSARQVLLLLRDLSRALVAVHQAGVVHRDVKEANILVRQEDGEAVLVDFGVSGCEQAARVTLGMMPPGTLEYRSPEAWRFRREHRSEPAARYRPTPPDDLYALGVVL